MSEDRPKGPSDSTLRHLAGMLPSFTKGVISRKATGQGRKVGTPGTHFGPRCVCPVCGKLFDHFQVAEQYMLKQEPCSKCDELLKGGFIAFVCGTQYAFAKSSMLPDMAGTIQQLQPETFEKVRQHFKDEWEVKERESEDGTVTE